MTAVTGIAMLGVAGVFLVVGYLIRYRGWVSLVAGYDPDSGPPPAVAARTAGNAMLRLGAGTGIVGVGIVGFGVSFGTDSWLVWSVYAVGVAVELGRVVSRLNSDSETATETD